jgi:hypothetical protein
MLQNRISSSDNSLIITRFAMNLNSFTINIRIISVYPSLMRLDLLLFLAMPPYRGN